jgi:hypothetical protein
MEDFEEKGISFVFAFQGASMDYFSFDSWEGGFKFWVH